MATKGISDVQVCGACRAAHLLGLSKGTSLEILMRMTGQPQKVCYRAMQRAQSRGYIGCGVSLRTAWVEEKGLALLKDQGGEAEC